MKLKPKTIKFIKIFLILWLLLIIYEFFFMNTKFGLNKYISEDSILYILIITVPLIALCAFLGAFIFASHYKEISDTWKNKPEQIIDELKLIGIGILFFLFITVVYIIIYKPFYWQIG